MRLRMEAIVPQKLLINVDRLKRAIETSLEMVAEDVRTDFQVTTQTWTKRPTFIIARKPGQRLIYTSNLIYKFVSGGTKAHLIYPKMTGRIVRSIVETKTRGKRSKIRRFYKGLGAQAPRLAFFGTGFRPKSRAGWIGSNKGRAASKNFTRPLYVRHPGNSPRNYPGVIQKKWRKVFPKLMQRAIDAEAVRG